MNWKIIFSFLDLIFPKRCVKCSNILSTESQSHLCVKCFSELPFTNWNFDNKNLMAKSINEYVPILGAYSPLFYYKSTSSKSLIQRLKYQNYSSLGREMASFLIPELSKHTNQFLFKGIIYVPIHPKKEKIRGYNQLKELSEELSKQLNIPLIEDALITSVYQKSQTSKNKNDRFSRRSNVFKNNKKLLPGNYLLIDDVFTTGSTIIHCIKELNKNPEIKIGVVTIAYSI